ncbi:hypothetical protein ACMFKE_04855 [Staphylococcus haemolyticus]|uniref:DUF1381 domain-containing protein n=1 Tax=Staphylococcus haemolyticus TaxID=1283 RepID=UPI0039BC239C
MTEFTIIFLATIFSIIVFYLYSYLTNKVLRICSFIILDICLVIAINVANAYNYLDVVLILLFLVILFELAELKIKTRELQIHIINIQNAVHSIKFMDLGVKEGIVKNYLIRVLDNDDEHIEVMQQRINEQFYVIEADTRENAIERYKQLKNHSS